MNFLLSICMVLSESKQSRKLKDKDNIIENKFPFKNLQFTRKIYSLKVLIPRNIIFLRQFISIIDLSSCDDHEKKD